MKAWIKTFFCRIGDLIVKMISVKGLFAIGMTVIAILNRGQEGTMFWLGLAWCILIGLREVQKFYTLMKTGNPLLGQTSVVPNGEGK